MVVVGLVAGDRTPFTLLPEIDSDTLRARIRFPQGVTVETTRAAVQQVEAAALRLNDPEVLKHAGPGDLVINRFSVVGQRSGWLDENGSHLGEVVIELLPAEWRNLDCKRILAAWSQQIGVIEDVTSLALDRLQQGPTEKPLELRLLGGDLDVLKAAGDEAVLRLSEYAGVSGAEHDLRPGKRQVRVRLKPLARTLGITLEDLARQLRSGFYGGEAARVQRGRDEVRVQVRYPDGQRMSVSDIEQARVRSPDGREILFSELADYRVERGFATIQHQEGRRRVRVMADVDERLANAERILAEFESGPLQQILAKYPDIDYRIQGQHGQMVESLRSLFGGFAIALVAIYAVLAAMLGSYSQPLVIMFAVPLGFIGAILGHALTGYDLTIMSVFGLVALSGVVVNDALVLLDEINRNVKAGLGTVEATVDAGAVRFRAVVLTSITTVAGLAPLLLERSTQAQSLIPMAISLSFGLAFATVLTLVVVPALYVGFVDIRGAATGIWRGSSRPSTDTVSGLQQSSRP
jgi:multidrug efflux pump subunit AcrB